MSRRVLMIAPYFPPVMTAGTFRTVRFVKYLPEFGWESVVLTVDASEAEAAAALEQFSHPPTVVRVAKPSPPGVLSRLRRPKRSAAQHNGEKAAAATLLQDAPRPQGAIRRRLISLLRNAWCLATETPDKDRSWVRPAVRSGRRAVRQYNPEVIYTTGPPHSVHLIGLALKRLTGLPWVADFRDPWARRPWGPKERNPWGQRLWPWLERRCVRAADRVILNTDRMADDFRNYYRKLDRDKFVSIPNGCDPELAEHVDRLLAEQPTERTDNFIHLCHAGSLYRKRDPRPLIDAIGLLRDRGIHVRFEQIGHCDRQFDLESYAAQRGLAAHVRLEPQQPHDQVLHRMAEADMLALIQPDTDTQVPGKLFEMLLFRKPILAIADHGAVADLINTFDLGSVAAQRPGEIADTLQEVVASRLNGRECGTGWIEARSAFDGNSLTGRLAAAFDGLAANESRCAGREEHGNSPQTVDPQFPCCPSK